MVGPRGDPHRNTMNLHIYMAGRIIECDFCDTPEEEFLIIFGCIAGGGIEG